MKLTKKEIYDHFTFCVEIETDEGYRYWTTCEGFEAWREEIKRVADRGELSDADYCTKHDYPGMQEFFDGYYDWVSQDCSRLGLEKPINTYYDTVYALS